jgi:hypothetical protein
MLTGVTCLIILAVSAVKPARGAWTIVIDPSFLQNENDQQGISWLGCCLGVICSAVILVSLACFIIVIIS